MPYRDLGTHVRLAPFSDVLRQGGGIIDMALCDAEMGFVERRRVVDDTVLGQTIDEIDLDWHKEKHEVDEAG